MNVLLAWSSFYVMIGSSAAALTGLMFVVITLVNREMDPQRVGDGISTFSTPTVAHFCTALFVAAVLSAPWPSLLGPSVVLGLLGAFGVGYVLRVMHRTKHLTLYNADLEDWIWYTLFPIVAYCAILVGGILLASIPQQALFVLAGGTTLLIFIGIRNAWDTVTFIAIGGPGAPPNSP